MLTVVITYVDTVVIHILSGLILHTRIFGGGIDEEVSNPSTLESLLMHTTKNPVSLEPLPAEKGRNLEQSVSLMLKGIDEGAFCTFAFRVP